MDRYRVIKQLGDGTYGEVLKASNKATGEIVAVKRMKRKYRSWEECIALKEVKVLRKMKHPNIVRLKEVIKENDILYFVFEFLDQNLYELSKNRRKAFPECAIRNYMFHVLQGLSYMHKCGYYHRDIKPENILVCGDIAKVADFGLAKEIHSRPPQTDYVSTRWYRAPEVLLRSPSYNAPIDVWAVGCMMVELMMLRPLFPGSSEADVLFKICTVLGTPTAETWRDGIKQASMINYRFPKLSPAPLQSIVQHASQESLAVIADMLLWDPSQRPTCSECLQYPFFRVGLDIPAPEMDGGETRMVDLSSCPAGLDRLPSQPDIPGGPGPTKVDNQVEQAEGSLQEAGTKKRVPSSLALLLQSRYVAGTVLTANQNPKDSSQVSQRFLELPVETVSANYRGPKDAGSLLSNPLQAAVKGIADISIRAGPSESNRKQYDAFGRRRY